MKHFLAAGSIIILMLGCAVGISPAQHAIIPEGEPGELHVSLAGSDPMKDKCWIWSDKMEDSHCLWCHDAFDSLCWASDSCLSYGKHVDLYWSINDCSPPYYPFLVETVRIGMHSYLWPGPEDLDVVFGVEIRDVADWSPVTECPTFSPGRLVWTSPPITVPLPPGWCGCVEVDIPGVWVYEPFAVCWHLLFHPPYHIDEGVFGWMTDLDGVYPCLNWVGAGTEWYDFYWDLDQMLGYDNDLVIRVGGRPQWNVAVTMGDFSAVPGDGRVTLLWQTFSETDNAYWVITRDGRRITRLEGQGSKETPSRYRYADTDLTNGQTYSYFLEAWSFAGEVETFGPVTATPAAAVGLPDECILHQNHPNPFNAATDIGYQLPAAEHVTLKIFNTLGQEVCTLEDGAQEAGVHSARWDGCDNDGRPVSSGLYFCRMKAGGYHQTIKVLMLR